MPEDARRRRSCSLLLILGRSAKCANQALHLRRENKCVGNSYANAAVESQSRGAGAEPNANQRTARAAQQLVLMANHF
jgi:hypothetical protein